MNTEPDTIEEADTSGQYIRTFAKDFAELAKKDPEGASHAKDKPRRAPKAAPLDTKDHTKYSKNRIDDQPIKEFDPGDLSKINLDTGEISNEHPQDIVEADSKEKTGPEVLELPKIEDDDIIKPVQKSISGEPTDAERAQILARLKARASTTATHQDNPKVTLDSQSYREPIPAPTIEVPKTPLIDDRTIPLPQKEASSPSPIHTFTSDFSDRIDEKQASTFSVLAAEKDAPVQRRPPQTKKVNLLPIVIGILLLLVGGGAIFVGFVFMSKNPPVAIITTPPTLIPYDSKAELSGSGIDLLKAFADKANQPLPINSVLLVYTTESTTTTQGTAQEQGTGGDFISQLSLNAPDILLRNIDPSSMVGIVNDGNQTRPFFILRVTSYERTFAGMLQWEPSMQRSLSLLYPLYPQPQVPQPVTATIASSSPHQASSTPVSTPIFIPVANPSAPASEFVDEIVSNRSVRALKDNSGKTIVLYGYADKATLIITRDETSFTFLLGRLSSSAS